MDIVWCIHIDTDCIWHTQIVSLIFIYSCITYIRTRYRIAGCTYCTTYFHSPLHWLVFIHDTKMQVVFDTYRHHCIVCIHLQYRSIRFDTYRLIRISWYSCIIFMPSLFYCSYLFMIQKCRLYSRHTNWYRLIYIDWYKICTCKIKLLISHI